MHPSALSFFFPYFMETSATRACGQVATQHTVTGRAAVDMSLNGFPRGTVSKSRNGPELFPSRYSMRPFPSSPITSVTGNRMTSIGTINKPFSIEKRRVYEAYKAVKSNRGAAGVDEQTLEMFRTDLAGRQTRRQLPRSFS